MGFLSSHADLCPLRELQQDLRDEVFMCQLDETMRANPPPHYLRTTNETGLLKFDTHAWPHCYIRIHYF